MTRFKFKAFFILLVFSQILNSQNTYIPFCNIIDVRSYKNDNDLKNEFAVNKDVTSVNGQTIIGGNMTQPINQTFNNYYYVANSSHNNDNKYYIDVLHFRKVMLSELEKKTEIYIDRTPLKSIEESNIDEIINFYEQNIIYLTNQIPDSFHRLKIVKQIKENKINSPDCIIENYEEVIEIKRKNGENQYLIDFDKIKNDPNIIFTDFEHDGFKIARKFNKFGYLSSNHKYYNIPFKYDECIPFENGLAIASDHKYRYIINKKGENVFKIKKIYSDSITRLYNNYFIIHKYATSYLINDKGKKVTQYYSSITPYASSSKIILSTKKIERVKKKLRKREYIFVYDTIKSLITYKGKPFSNRIDNKKLRNFLKSKRIDKKILNYLYTSNIIEITNEIPKKVIFLGQYFSLDKIDLIIKDFESDKIIECRSIDEELRNFKSGLFTFYIGSEFFIKFIHVDRKIRKLINFQNPYNLTVFTIPKNKFYEKMSIYSLKQNKIIGVPVANINNVYTWDKLMNFRAYVKFDDLESLSSYRAEGIMNYEGLEIIPPIFRTINKYKDYFEVNDFRENIKYKVNFKGVCLTNCEEYKRLRKQYYSLNLKEFIK